MGKSIIHNMTGDKLCSGCGVCVAICPHQNLEMQLDENGVLISRRISEDCPSGCSLCVSVCPFVAEESTDALAKGLFGSNQQVKHRAETGYYLKACIGHVESETLRNTVASGGFATAMLEGLLSNGDVDHVITVRPTGKNSSKMLFEAAIVSTPEALRQCAGSCYYPVSFDAVLREVAISQSKYAMVALPCVCRAIRLAQKVSSRFQNIRYLFALTCGTSKSTFFTDYIAAATGVDPGQIVGIRYRDKSQGLPVNAYSTQLEYIDKSTGQVCRKYTSWQKKRIGSVFCSRLFSPPACNFCDDVFGECADASFMDAWLADYAKQPLGTSIALFRHPALLDRFLTLPGVQVDEIPVEQVIACQRGALGAKRMGLSVRLNCSRSRPETHPNIREQVLSPFRKISVLRRLLFRVQYHLSKTSFINWRRSNNNTTIFWKHLWFTWQLYRVINQLLSIPIRLNRLRKR